MAGRLLAPLLFLLFSVWLQAQPCDCVTTGNCPVPIEDNGTFQGTLDVTVNGPNDLGACPLTSVCLQITHTWVGDLSVSLTSPSGTTYLIMADVDNDYGGCGNQNDNVDICIVPGNFNPLTNNTEYICNSAPCYSGTCCLTGNWNLPCGGVFDPVTNAPQAPNCDLNDFNIPGQPANGTWTLTINDICANDVGFLDNFTLTFACGTILCTVCEADGGTLGVPTATGCVGDPDLVLDLPPSYGGNPPPDPAEYSYAYALVQNDIIFAIQPDADLSSLPPGSYQVCGLSYLTIQAAQVPSLIGLDYPTAKAMLESTTAPFCGDFSDDCTSVIIGPPIAPSVFDTLVCPGTCIEYAGQQICESGVVTLQSWLGCDSMVQVNLIPIVIPISYDTVTVCNSECVTMANEQLCGPGPHLVTWQSYQGCDSTVQVTLIEVPIEATISPEDPPMLSCTNPSSMLYATASLPANASYEWSGPAGFTSTADTIEVSVAGTYVLTVFNNAVDPPCTDTDTIEIDAQFDEPNLQVNSAPVICLGDSIDLDTLDIVDLDSTGALITFHTAYPPDTTNELSSTVVASSDTTVYYILATHGSCTDVDSVTVAVRPLPLASILADTTGCQAVPLSIEADGGDTTMVYTWDFDGGTADPAAGPGPHAVTWSSAGVKMITLVVTDTFGCASQIDTHFISIDPALVAPVIDCQSTNSSVTFVWNAVPNAAGYSVTVTSGQTGSMVNDTTFTVTGISPLTTVNIELEVISPSSCENLVLTASCTAQNCPPVNVNIDPVAPICLDTSTGTVQLNATVTGGSGSGMLVWGGSPAVHPLTGEFYPQSATMGANTVQVTYSEGPCQFNANTTIYVWPVPSAEFQLDAETCLDDTAHATYTGAAGNGANFYWDFGTAVATPGAGPGPHQLSWNTSGTHSVALVVEENGCTSDTITHQTTVEAPLPPPAVVCNATTSSITFAWPQVPGAAGYAYTVLTGQSATALADTLLQVSGLEPGDSVQVTVEAVGAGPCGSSFSTTTCYAAPCPEVQLSIAADTICRTPDSQPFVLEVSRTGGSGTGTYSWSGSGIVDTVTGTFDPAEAMPGENLVTVVYAEDNCTFSTTQNILVIEQPQADIDVPQTVCQGDTAEVAWSGSNAPDLLWHWDFGAANVVGGTGAGPYQLSWPLSGNHSVSAWVEDGFGCASVVASADVEVAAPLQPPLIQCSTTTNTVAMTWDTVPGAAGYTAQVLKGPQGIFNPGQYLFSGLLPGDTVTLALTVNSGGPCPDVTVVHSCIAKDCPPLDVSIQPVPTICLGNAAPFDLSASVSGGSGTGTGTWVGPGITNASTGTFDPFAAGFGTHQITYTYTEDGCTASASTTIEVWPVPSANFTTDDQLCLGDIASVTYTGNAGPAAVFDWDFGKASLLAGSGAGPYQLQWAEAGLDTLRLLVSENGCSSKPWTAIVSVEAPLETPVISCVNATSGSVTFAWNDIPGANGYLVNTLQGPAGVFTSATSYQVEGLQPGDTVTVEVIAQSSNVCPDAATVHTCVAADCPPVDLQIAPMEPLCLQAGMGTYTLEATANGQPVSGQWSGPGIMDADTGMFDPMSVGPGTHQVSFTWTQGNCSYQTSSTITLVDPPTADAGEDTELNCFEGHSSAQLGGALSSAGADIVYDWDFSGGPFPGDSTALHPEVSSTGTYVLHVIDLVYGCSDSDTVVVEGSTGVPMPEVSISPISCFGEHDGSIRIVSVSGGEPPYFFSLDGSPYSENKDFQYLQPGQHTLSVIDINGCESSLVLDIWEPGPLDVNLVALIEDDNIIHFGDSLQLLAVVSLPLDSLENVIWQPDSLFPCQLCLDPVVQPLKTTTFSVTVESHGCSASDELTIFVLRDKLVYAPTAFSPNGDGTNDRFRLYPGNQVRWIHEFKIFDRWGEMVYSESDFDPFDPDIGWDGTFRKEQLHSGVYTWLAKVEFLDGTTEILQGAVTLMRN
ncbi:MAG: hypothetical protein KatS3mg029_0119 [Saprospiraceae bacterium]|nr:MAG: hypothetical protein KatS3mg029_0119 [Saprospiraceae bacterium]